MHSTARGEEVAIRGRLRDNQTNGEINKDKYNKTNMS